MSNSQEGFTRCLKALRRMMHADGSAVSGSLAEYLKRYNVGQSSYIATYLRNQGIVEARKDGRSFLNYWKPKEYNQPDAWFEALYNEAKGYANNQKRGKDGGSDINNIVSDVLDTNQLPIDEFEVLDPTEEFHLKAVEPNPEPMVERLEVMNKELIEENKMLRNLLKLYL